MEFSEAFRPEDIAKTDFFDFVVTPEDNDIVLHNNLWSRKSMGLFSSSNNNHHHHHHHDEGAEQDGGAAAKEANNNSILPNFAVDDSFWDTGGKAAFAAAAAVNIKMEESLEDISDICWPSSCSAATPDDKDTDGSIYTLTVVNGQQQHQQQQAAVAAAGGQQAAAAPGAAGQQQQQQPTAAAATPAVAPPPQPPPPQTPGGDALPPPLWYRPPDLSSILREGDEQLRQAMSAMDSQYQTSLDIDSIISILPSMEEHGDMAHGDMAHGDMAHGDMTHGALGLFAAPAEELVEDSGFESGKEERLKQQSLQQQQQQAGELDEVAYGENNNDWGYSNHNASSAAESLLRSALQGGKQSAYLYAGPPHQAHPQQQQQHLPDGKTLTELGAPGSGGGSSSGGGVAAPDHASLGLFMSSDSMGMMFEDGGVYGGTQCSSSMDDILLSPLDDYDKLKMIESEVAESAKRYGVPHHYGAAPPPPSAPMAAPHSSTPTTTSTATPRPKKKAAKRGGDRPAKPKASVSSSASAAGGGGGAASGSSSNGGGGARRERSLHHCTICSKAFKDKYSVNVHIRTHTGEKPFACSVCGKSFRQKAHLAKHYHTHIVQKSEHLASKALSTKAR